MKTTLLVLSILASAWGQSLAVEPAFALKDGDTWVMAGDSITAQRLHTNYIEAFFRTRYPQWHLHFRNSGIGGNRTNHILDRFNYDVAAWRPTIVSIELGMNDVGGHTPEEKDCASVYTAGMKKLAENIRGIHAQPLFISSSPVNDGSLLNAWTSLRCRMIHPFTESLKELGHQENVRMIDQYHPLLALWGPNKILDDAYSLASRVRILKPENNIPELSTLQAFAKSWEGKSTGVSLGGDGVHPGPVGQYMMAATILNALEVDKEVSSATINTDGTVVAAKSCKITGVTSKGGKLSFTRLDDRTPWPLAPACASALSLMPKMADLSHYTLTVAGLSNGQYSVAIGGKRVATLSGKELAKGWNMSTVVEGPMGERSTKILNLVNDLQTTLNNNWREASKANDAEKLTVAQKAIDECEANLQAACQPSPITFDIAPAK